MRAVGVGIVALVAGYLLGGVQPRRDLADIESEMAELREALSDAEKAARKAGRTQIFNIPGVGDFDLSDGGAGDDGSYGDGDDLTEPDAEREEGWGEDEYDGSGGRPSARDLPAEELDLAVEAQRMRASQARAALIERLELDGGEVEELDAIIGDMNDRFADIADDIAAVILSGDEPSPSDMLGMGHDATGILYDAQRDMEDLVGAEALSGMEDNTSGAWNYIDLGPMRDATLDLAEGME